MNGTWKGGDVNEQGRRNHRPPAKFVLGIAAGADRAGTVISAPGRRESLRGRRIPLAGCAAPRAPARLVRQRTTPVAPAPGDGGGGRGRAAGVPRGGERSRGGRLCVSGGHLPCLLATLITTACDKCAVPAPRALARLRRAPPGACGAMTWRYEELTFTYTTIAPPSDKKSQVYINGQFAGLYEVVEEVSSQLIQVGTPPFRIRLEMDLGDRFGRGTH